MEIAKTSKLGVPYLHFGKGDPLVLIHGLGEVKEGWEDQYELANHYELIIPDLRGHGECNKTDGISIKNFAIDILGLLKELKIETAHILGLSMGGAVAQEMYRQAPKCCRTLLLISSFHYFPKKLKSILYEPRKKLLEQISLSKEHSEYASRMALYSWNKETVQKFDRIFQPKRQIFVDSLAACFEVNNLSLLPMVNVPTLIVGGQYDSILPVWIQVWMHQLIPHSEFIIMRNTGHLAKLEAKDRFNNLLKKFIEQQKTAS
ncbi:alpha/beta fold hydrolase [Neobacillus drentensis]|uniref:alpha/beta fold hydrolase n=1 Tax=Neobacillus drentensis TaxID=220684 RepID=UPI003001895A